MKRLRFDLPRGIEQSRADWDKVVGEVKEALTQLRGKVKQAASSHLSLRFLLKQAFLMAFTGQRERQERKQVHAHDHIRAHAEDP